MSISVLTMKFYRNCCRKVQRCRKFRLYFCDLIWIETLGRKIIEVELISMGTLPYF